MTFFNSSSLITLAEVMHHSLPLQLRYLICCYYLSSQCSKIKFDKYRHPSAREQSTTLPTPVYQLNLTAASTDVIPNELDTKSAKQFAGNQYFSFVLPVFRRGSIPATERQFRSWPGLRAISPVCPQPLTLRITAFLLSLNIYSGPKPWRYKTPGLKGSIMIVVFFISYLRNYLSLGFSKEKKIDCLKRFIVLFEIGTEKGAGFLLAAIITQAPWSAKIIPRNIEGTNPSNSSTVIS